MDEQNDNPDNAGTQTTKPDLAAVRDHPGWPAVRARLTA